MKEDIIEINLIINEIEKKSSGCFKDMFGGIYYLLNGKYHKSDGPAIKYAGGNKFWYYYGHKAKSKKQFYNPQWRKKIEIKELL